MKPSLRVNDHRRKEVIDVTTLEAKFMSRYEELKRELDRINEQLKDYEKLQQRRYELTFLFDELQSILNSGHAAMSSEGTGVMTRKIVLPAREEDRGPKELCVEILNENVGRYFNDAQMAEELLAHGYKTNAKNFVRSVRSTLGALVKENKIACKKGVGRKRQTIFTSLKTDRTKEGFGLLVA